MVVYARITLYKGDEVIHIIYHPWNANAQLYNVSDCDRIEVKLLSDCSDSSSSSLDEFSESEEG